MTQDTKHHEDVAVVTIHLHEDELLALARFWQADGAAVTGPEFDLAAAAERRIFAAARDVLHADRADRRKASA